MAAGDVSFRAGDVVTDVFAVQTGRVAMLRNPDGEQVAPCASLLCELGSTVRRFLHVGCGFGPTTTLTQKAPLIAMEAVPSR